MKVLDKEAFFATDDLPLVPVPLPEMYGDDVGFYTRTVTGDERSELERRFSGKGEAIKNPGAFRSTILISCIVKEDGEHVFNNEDAPRLMAKNGGTLEILFEAACEENGFTKKDVETIEGN